MIGSDAGNEYRVTETADDYRQHDSEATNEQGSDPSYEELGGETVPSPFPHPPWTLGLVLVAGVITLIFGVLVNPIWLGVGAQFLIALVLWLYVKLVVRP